MTAKEAYVIVKKKNMGMHIYACTEYKDVFVFNMCAEKDKELLPKVRGFMWSINKETGEGKMFMPFHMPIEEYRNGKQVKDFK